MKNLKKVSIIFPNHNGGKEPLECLSSIKKLNFPQNKIEVIVVDNNSTDSSPEEIKKRFPLVRLLKLKKNIGFARSINLGLRKAKGEYIFIGNDDLVFARDSLKNMLNYYLTEENIGVVGGKIFFKKFPQRIASCGFIMNKWTSHVYKAGNPDKIKEPDWLQGCALLIPKRVLTTVGSLDPNFTLLFDDYDLCLRIKKAGFKVVYLPRAVFWHGESITVDKNKPHKYYHWYKSKFYFILKQFPLINLISIVFLQIFIISPGRALIKRDGRWEPFLNGLIWNIKRLPLTLKTRRDQINLRGSLPQNQILPFYI